MLKASQVLSGEIILDQLLQKLMEVALENAGAHRGALVLAGPNGLSIEILTTLAAGVEKHEVASQPLERAKEVPVSVIQYVARTQEDLVLHDPRHEDIFTQDEYILQNKPHAILCVPILSKSALIGVLYLENQQTTQAFNSDRVAIMKLLASQSAIAIENARLYRQLNESRDKYLSLYQNAVEGIFEVDLNGNVISINPAAAQILGYNSPEEFLAQAKEQSEDSWVDTDMFTGMREQMAKEGRVLDYESELRKRDGTVVSVSQSAQVILGEDGKPSHVEGSIVDITERRLREAAEQATQLAETAAETKSQFLATMSHEIRTPMNAIVGYADLALDTPLTEEQKTYLNTIKQSSDHLLHVVNDILDISKVESGKLALQRVQFDLNDLFTELRNMFELEVRSKDVQLKLPSPSFARFTGDPYRIGQILINLISNAIKFTREGEIAVELESLPLESGHYCLNFVVSDTGMGISKEDLPHIFDSFSQAGSWSTSEGKIGRAHV